jgi:hypothetical protein
VDSEDEKLEQQDIIIDEEVAPLEEPQSAE